MILSLNVRLSWLVQRLTSIASCLQVAVFWPQNCPKIPAQPGPLPPARNRPRQVRHQIHHSAAVRQTVESVRLQPILATIRQHRVRPDRVGRVREAFHSDELYPDQFEADVLHGVC